MTEPTPLHRIPVTPPERIRLGRFPTPIQKLSRLSEELAGPEIYIKRDDLCEIALSGNKLRKLEFLAADAIAHGCDALLTFGAVQSNHCRITAGVAARLGLGCELFLSGPRPECLDGNALLDDLMGARLTFAEDAAGVDRDAFTAELSRGYARQGRRLYVIPGGGSNPLGCWGYVDCMHEIALQQQQLDVEFDAIVCTVGSGGTLAGLLAGKAIYGIAAELFGVYVGNPEGWEPMRRHTAENLAELSRRFAPGIPLIPPEDLPITDEYRGIAYAESTAEEIETLRRVARSEGIILDTAYTLKAFHGMLEEIRKGRFHAGQKLLFIHTGGIYGIFPKRQQILSLSGKAARP